MCSKESICFTNLAQDYIQFATHICNWKKKMFPRKMLARPLLVVAISSLWSSSTGKNSSKAFLHLVAWDQVFLPYLSAVTFHFCKYPWHMIQCIAIWLVLYQLGQFCCGLQLWWNTLIPGFPYVRGLGHWCGRRKQGECIEPAVVRNKISHSPAILKEAWWDELSWGGYPAMPPVRLSTAPTGRRREERKDRPWMVGISCC